MAEENTVHEAPAAAEAPAPKRPRTQQTGRRKEAVARVRLVAGTGAMKINNRPIEDYFPREGLRTLIAQPLTATRQHGNFDVIANVQGGGLTGQAGAVRLGVARALASMDPAHRENLRNGGFLTRDPRMKERKKYGQKGARKRFQWTKR